MGTMQRKPRWPGLLAGIALCWLGTSAAPAQHTGLSAGAQASKPSIGQSISEGFKNGFGKVTGALSPKTRVKPAEDPLSLSTKAEPSARLFVALAKLQEQEGRLAAAAERYEQALKKDPNYPGALLGYARLKERLGHPAEAEKLYEQAAKAHPREPSVANNAGLFYAKRKQYPKAVAALGQAVRLKPQEAKYRHNLALVLVQMGRNEEAFRHLRAVHTEAVSHYNLGYLLRTKGDGRAARFHFAQALRADSSMVAAKRWLAQLGDGSQLAERGAPAPAAAPTAAPGAAPARAPAVSPPPVSHEAAAPPRVRLDVGSPPGPAQSPVSPPYGAERPGAPDPVIRFIPPPPRRTAPARGPVSPNPSSPRLGGPRAPLPGGTYQPSQPGGPPLPPASRQPPPIRRLPNVN